MASEDDRLKFGTELKYQLIFARFDSPIKGNRTFSVKYIFKIKLRRNECIYTGALIVFLVIAAIEFYDTIKFVFKS